MENTYIYICTKNQTVPSCSLEVMAKCLVSPGQSGHQAQVQGTFSAVLITLRCWWPYSKVCIINGLCKIPRIICRVNLRWWIIVKFHSQWGLLNGLREPPLYESKFNDHASNTRNDFSHRQAGSNTISHVNELDNDIFMNNICAYFLLNSIETMQNRFANLDILLIYFYFGDPLATISDGKNDFW